jgi:hypothetical protein
MSTVMEPVTVNPVPENGGVLHVLNETGDTEVHWNRNSEAEVAAARATFDSLRAKGYMAYRVEPGGGRGSVMREFDARAERVVLAPAMQGG